MTTNLAPNLHAASSGYLPWPKIEESSNDVHNAPLIGATKAERLRKIFLDYYPTLRYERHREDFHLASKFHTRFLNLAIRQQPDE